MHKEYTASNYNFRKTFLNIFPMQVNLCIAAGMDGLIDGIMIGHLVGDSALAVTGLVAPLITFMVMLTNLIVGGSIVLIGQHIGKNEKDKAKQIYSLSVALLTIISILMTVILAAISGPIATMLGAKDNLVVPTSKYILGLAFSCFGICFYNLLNAIIVFDYKTKLSILSTGIMMATNIGLNILLTYVFQSLEDKTFGLALATAISYYAGIIVLLPYFISKKTTFKFRFSSIKWGNTLDLIKIGLPVATVDLCMALTPFIMNRLLIASSDNYSASIGAMGIGNSIQPFINAFGLGLAKTILVVASILVTEKDEVSYKGFLKQVLIIGLPIVLLIDGLIVAFAPFIVKLFTSDSGAMANYSTYLIRGIGIAQMIMCIVLISSYSYQSILYNGRVLVLNILSSLVFPVIFSLCFVLSFAINGICLAYILSPILTLLVIYLWISIESRSFRMNLMKWMLWNKNIDVDENHRLDLSFHKMKDVISISSAIHSFSLKNGIDNRRAYFMSLAIEEMCGNIIKYGKKENPQVDLRIVINDDKTVHIRIRDNCIPFNPVSQIEKEKKLFANGGIYLVLKLSKSMNYQSLFNMNVLQIDI